MIYIIFPISMICLYIFLKKKEKRRIKELEDLIDRLYKKDYSIPMVQDDFSILEDKIYKIFLKLVEAREEMSQISKKQVENMENIAHQIKTPITSMMLDLETIEVNEANRKQVNRLNFQLERLNSLSDNLLKLSSLDENIEKMEKKEVFLSEIVDYALDILDDSIEKNHIEVHKNIGDEKINVDYYWVCEAFINIIKNSISIDETRNINITSSKNPIYTGVLIEDDGGGIKDIDLKKIFKRFYKSPDSNGFGIGLSMAKSIIEINNGDISAYNKDHGAVFDIKFYSVT